MNKGAQTITTASRHAAQTILINARKSISAYCIHECKALCCRKGTLVMTPIQATTVVQGTEKNLLQTNRLALNAAKETVLTLDDACPSLKNNMCTIYTNTNRPEVCDTYPISMKNDLISTSSKCTAVKANLLYPFIRELHHMGFASRDDDRFAQTELDRLEK